MKTCSVVVELMVNGNTIQTKHWDTVDVMKTAHTRGWATRRFNSALKDFDRTNGMRDSVILVEWRCRHHDENLSFSGRLSGVHGRLMSKSGIFDQ